MDGSVVRDAASLEAVAVDACPQVIPLEDANALDSFAPEPVKQRPLPAVMARAPEAPAPLPAGEPEPALPAAPLVPPPRSPRPIRIRVPNDVRAAAIVGLTLAPLGLPAISFLTAAPAAVPLSAGAVTVTSEPPGVTVRVDGVSRGVTPFATMLIAGPHRVEVGDGADVRVRQLQVRPGAEALLHITWAPAQAVHPPDPARHPADVAMPAPPARAIVGRDAAAAAPSSRPAPIREAAKPAAPVVATGTLAVTSPFLVRVVVDGTEIGTSATAKHTVPAGARSVRLVNERLEFEQALDLTITARRSHAVAVDPPQGTLHVNAAPWAHVWIDGRRAGDTPLGNIVLPVGEHEVVLRHPELGEERRTITVGARTPVRVGVEFTR